MLIVSTLNIGSVYLATGDNENAHSWPNKALVCSSNMNDSSLMAKCYLNLGICYKNTGDTSSAIQNYKAVPKFLPFGYLFNSSLLPSL